MITNPTRRSFIISASFTARSEFSAIFIPKTRTSSTYYSTPLGSPITTGGVDGGDVAIICRRDIYRFFSALLHTQDTERKLVSMSPRKRRRILVP